METATITVSIVVPTIFTLVLFVATVLNWVFQKRWFNLIQAGGLSLWVLPNALRLAVPGLVGSYDSLQSRLLGSGAMLGFAIFALGYLAMAIEKRGSQLSAAPGYGTDSAAAGQ